MNLRQQKRAIWLAAGALGLVALAVLAAGVAVPLELAPDEPDIPPAPENNPAADRGAEQARAERARGELAALQRVASLDLRRPLHDAPAAGGPSKVPMTVRLIGTVKETGHSMAMFQKKDGTIELCAEGESIDDTGGAVTVKRIDQETVTVEYADETVELVLAPNTGGRARP